MTAPEPRPRLVLVAGGTRTAAIEGISAAGADPEVLAHTPAADAEILAHGRPIEAPGLPVSPTGCPTPAVVTRAARERLGFEATTVDAGLAAPTAAPTVPLDAAPGGDVRTATPVPDARRIFGRASEFGARLSDAELLVGETIPGGTTTAMGVLRALGERAGVSSSLPDNPTGLKREVVAEGLDASGIEAGGLTDDPLAAIAAMGDPVLAATAGAVAGALETGTGVTLAGGTQMLAVAAVLRHTGVSGPLPVATTSYVVADDSAAFRALASDLDVVALVTDPGFGAAEGSGLTRYVDGEGKEGVGMGGALALAERLGALGPVRERSVSLCRELRDRGEATTRPHDGVSPDGS